MKASLQEELEETSNKVISTWAAIEFIYPVIVMMLNILCATHACTIHALWQLHLQAKKRVEIMQRQQMEQRMRKLKKANRSKVNDEHLQCVCVCVR